MSDYERPEGAGALFRNEKKEHGSNQPDYTGVAKVDGRDRRLAAWLKEGKNGNRYMSLKVSDFDPQYSKGAGRDDGSLSLDDDDSRALRSPRGVSDDEIPF
jgi:uncharacterized protein (DUF736 family)